MVSTPDFIGNGYLFVTYWLDFGMKLPMKVGKWRGVHGSKQNGIGLRNIEITTN